MRATVLAIGVIVLCALTVHGDIPVQKNFDLNQFLGKWYVVGMASDAQWFLGRKDKFKMSTIIMAPGEDGHLNVTLIKNKVGGCWQMDFVYNKTDQEGRFKYHSKRWNNDNDVRVVETNYDEFALVHSIKTKGDEVTMLVKMLSRGQELRSELVKEFRQYCFAQGLNEDNIQMFPKEEECQPSRNWI